MKIFKNKSLKDYNTCHIDIKAEEFVLISSFNDFHLLKDYFLGKNKKMIIGDAANILFLNDYPGLILKNEIKGKKIVKKEGNKIYIEVNSGEVWDDFVRWCVINNIGGGIENLISIPGRAGSGVVQNIGAYGVEIKDLVKSVKVFDFKENKIKELKNKELKFSYRYSLFKEDKDRYFILSLILELIENPNNFILNYGQLREVNGENLNLRYISSLISEIRKKKLPDYRKLGNCGSFFKNPLINTEDFKKLKEKYNDLRYYMTENNNVKIPAAWLIEKAGFKGKKYKGAGVYEKHSLILVNHGNAKGTDIKELSDIIIEKVFEMFKIKLEPEVIFMS